MTVAENAPPPVVTYISTNVDTNDTTSYSFASQNIGTATDDRYIVVAAGAHGAANLDCTIASISIGGNAATLHIAPGGTGARALGIGTLLVPTGSTATIAVTTSGTAGVMRIFVATVTGLSLGTAYDTDGAKLNISGTTQSVTLDIRKLAFFYGGGVAAAASMSWSSAAVLQTADSEVASYATSFAYLLAGGDNYTETFTQTSNSIRGLVAVSFN